MKPSLLTLPVLLLLLPLLLLGCNANAKQSVSFKNLKNGATVKSPVVIKFGLSGMELTPAGQKKECRTCGHHHIIVDAGPVPMGTAVKDDPKAGYYHYGKAQTEATIELTPGKHKLTMQFADCDHISFGEAMSATIDITVEDPAAKTPAKKPENPAKKK